MANMYVNDMTDLWNTTGTVYSAIKMNVTNAGSAAASKLLDLQVGTVPKFGVDRNGNVTTAGTLSTIGVVSSGANLPSGDGTAALGASGTAWSNLFLASTGVINWAAGDISITHATNTMLFGGATSGYVFDALVKPLTDSNVALGIPGAAWSNLFLGTNGSVTWASGDVAITHAANALAFTGAATGYSFDAQIKPSGNDTAALGVSGTAWSDLFLADGGVINWKIGDVSLTHTTGVLTVNPGDFRVTTAGTNTASVVTVGGSQNLINKTLTSPTLAAPIVTGLLTTAAITTVGDIGVTGNITASGNITSGQNHISSTALAVLATTGAGTIALRPNGAASTVGQATIDSAGNLVLGGSMDAGELSGTIAVARLPATVFTTDTTQTIVNAARKTILSDTNIAQAGPSNFQIQSAANSQWAFMTFHSPAAFASNFGLNPNGNYYKGGYSHQANYYCFWDQLNTPQGTLQNIRDSAGDYRLLTPGMIEARMTEWANWAVAQTMGTIAAQSGNAVGAYGMLCRDGGGGQYLIDNLITGSALAWSNVNCQLMGRPNGTWRCVGYVSNGSTTTGATTMWLRAS